MDEIGVLGEFRLEAKGRDLFLNAGARFIVPADNFFLGSAEACDSSRARFFPAGLLDFVCEDVETFAFSKFWEAVFPRDNLSLPSVGVGAGLGAVEAVFGVPWEILLVVSLSFTLGAMRGLKRYRCGGSWLIENRSRDRISAFGDYSRVVSGDFVVVQKRECT